MTCWHCNHELELNFETTDLTFKFYYCSHCDKWYEMRKEKEKVNGAVPVKFFELDSRPDLPTVNC